MEWQSTPRHLQLIPAAVRRDRAPGWEERQWGVPSAKYQRRVGAQRSRCKTCCEAGTGGGGICEHGALRFQCKNCRELTGWTTWAS